MKKFYRELLGFVVMFFSLLSFLETMGSELYAVSFVSYINFCIGIWLILAGKEK